MRGRDIFVGILLILSTIDFALAAPVLVQEKREEGATMTDAPEGVTTTILGKRWNQELEKLGEEYFKVPEKSIDSSSTHSSSSTAPSTSSTSNLDQSAEPCCPPSMQGLSARGNTCRHTCFSLLEDMAGISQDDRPMVHTPYGSYPQSSLKKAPAPQSMSKADPDPWVGWRSADIPSLSPTPPRPLRIAEGQSPSHTPSLPPPSESLGTAESTQPTESEIEVLPELQNGRLPLSSDSKSPPDPQAALYEAKGKAVMGSRGIPDTTRDGGNAVQRGLQPAERSLDPGEY